MEIIDKDFKVAYVSGFQYAIKSVSDFFHVSFMETCVSYGLRPAGLNIRKKPFIEFDTPGVFIVNFEHISDLVLIFLLLTLNM